MSFDDFSTEFDRPSTTADQNRPDHSPITRRTLADHSLRLKILIFFLHCVGELAWLRTRSGAARPGTSLGRSLAARASPRARPGAIAGAVAVIKKEVFLKIEKSSKIRG